MSIFIIVPLVISSWFAKDAPLMVKSVQAASSGFGDPDTQEIDRSPSYQLPRCGNLVGRERSSTFAKAKARDEKQGQRRTRNGPFSTRMCEEPVASLLLIGETRSARPGSTSIRARRSRPADQTQRQLSACRAFSWKCECALPQQRCVGAARFLHFSTAARFFSAASRRPGKTTAQVSTQ
jgi:hypothetical protein